MSPANLRAWIDLLRKEKELSDVYAEVDPYLEMTEVVDRMVKSGGPALLFHNPTGSTHPVLINQFGSEKRMCLAFGESNLDAVAKKLESVLGWKESARGSVDRIRELGALRRFAASAPRLVGRGACQEIVHDKPNLDLLPVQTCWPGDAAPFITLPAVITKDPRSGVRNVGI
jgi:4-hydroxy-3-polyprenylbenzoate decarboxylase